MNTAQSDWKPISGGCQCGAVRYTVHAPVELTNHCHCTMCRRMQGAIFGTWSRMKARHLTIDKGEENLTLYESSPPVRRRFCRTCGCPLFYEHEKEPGLIWITTATLDGGAHPGHPKERERHVCVESKVSWYGITDALPQNRDYTF